jgi:hypothetical protein
VQYIKSYHQDTVFSLPAGNYSLTVTDIDGCVGTSDEVFIQEKQPYNFSVIDITDNICAGDNNGAISIVVNGGKAPISVLWNNGLFSGLDISGLATGAYMALIVDQNQCRLETAPIIVSSLSDMVFVDDIINTSSGLSTGKICVTILGGASPYNFKWSNGMTSFPCLDNLNAGDYTLTVTDAFGCFKIKEYKIETQTKTKDENLYIPKVFPNPFYDIIYVQNLSELHSVSLYNIEFVKSDFTQQNSLDLEKLDSGIYILELEKNGSKFRNKIIKIE